MKQGAPADVVRMAMERGDPLSGTGGFAGGLESGTLVRDGLGRYPLFTEADDATTSATDPTALSDPDPVPAGHPRDADGDTRVFRLPDPALLADDGRAVAAVGSAVETVEGDPPVAFSGGLDSGLLAAGTDGRPFVGGCPDSDDVAAARSAAASLGRDLEVVEFTHDDLEAAVPEVVAATGRSNPWTSSSPCRCTSSVAGQPPQGEDRGPVRQRRRPGTGPAGTPGGLQTPD